MFLVTRARVTKNYFRAVLFFLRPDLIHLFAAPPVCVCAAEILGSVSTQHHHRDAEGAERHRGPPAGSGGRKRHPTRHRFAATQLRPQETGSTALETGGKRDFTLIFIHLFIIKMFLFSVYYLTMNVSRYVWLQVYVAAGSVYSLEAELSDLEECARGICSSTSDMKLSFLEEQVAAAAARVQQSELQVTRAPSLIFSTSLTLLGHREVVSDPPVYELHYKMWSLHRPLINFCQVLEEPGCVAMH